MDGKLDEQGAREERLNPDPVTGAPGSHPLGAGIGAAGGAATGAAVGAAGGPIVAAAGAVVGGLVGGITGKEVAEGFNPTEDEAYWRERYHREPYYESGYEFDDYGPAYAFGGRSWVSGTTFDSAEGKLSQSWAEAKGRSRLDWQRAREAARAGWNRVDENYRDRTRGSKTNPP